MKLFTRYNRINLLATVIIFLLSGIAFYFLLRYVLVSQVDEDLKIEQHEIQNYAGMYHRLPEIIAVRDQHTSYTATDKDGGRKSFSTIKMCYEKEQSTFRQLVFFIAVNGQWYRVTVSKSLEGTENMAKSIISITLITILLILAVSLLINRVVLRQLWQPFYATLAAMTRFELGKNVEPAFPVTTIDEFMVMNDTLKQAIAKADQDYLSLKEFTENASHELQTPLAIIQSKLDVLIQDEQLSEPQSRVVQAAYEAIQRVSRLNQGLLLLTKIENGQYTGTTGIDLTLKVKDKLRQFEEMIAAKNITVTTTADEPVIVEMNPLLADILLNNLLSNAIKYNVPGGTILISLKKGMLTVSNTGQPVALEASRLFRRFGRSGQSGDGVGLGLAIIRQAAAASGMDARYTFQDGLHQFVLADQ